MNLILFAPVLTVTTLLILQSCSYVFLKKSTTYARSAGELTILLAGSGLLVYFLLTSGALILIPEFRVAMVQGIPAIIGLGFLVIAISVAAGLGWHLVRCAKSLPSRLVWILTVSMIISVATIFLMPVLNSDDPEQLRIWCHDFWWPPLLIWLSACFTESVVAVLEIRNRWGRAWAGMLLPTALGLEVIRRSHLRFHFANPYTLVLWKVTLFLSLPATMVFGTLFFAERLEIQICTKRRWLRIIIAGIFGVVGVVSCWLWVGDYWHFVPILLRPWLLWLAWLVLLVWFVAFRLRRLWLQGKIKVPDFGEPGRLDDAVAFLALCALVFALADFLRFALLKPVWDLALVLGAWVVLLELLGGRPLRNVLDLEAFKKILTDELPLRALAAAIGHWARRTIKSAGDWLGSFFGEQKVAPLLLKAFMVFLLLIAIAEIPNAGKTIILPFDNSGLPKPEKERDLGQVTAQRIANTLGILRQELQPDVLILLPTEGNNAASSTVAISEETGNLQATVKTSDFEIPGTGFTVPMNLLTAWIQNPIRRLLNVNVIHGGIEEQDHRHILLANSIKGTTWRSPDEKPATQASAEKPAEILSLADEIAYRVMNEDPTWANLGLPQSWQVYQIFREGLTSWKKYETNQDFAKLDDAIGKFRKVVQLDPDFALAQYRLGRALTADGQPGLAADAFRAAVRARPNFAAAHIALANLLHSFNDYYYPLPPTISGGPASKDAGLARRLESLSHWKQAIRFSGTEVSTADRASAYTGLCTDAYESLYDKTTKAKQKARLVYQAAFYCGRAENLYTKLPVSVRTDPRIRAAEASSLEVLGYAIEWSWGNPPTEYTVSGQKGKEADWDCDWRSVDVKDLTPDGKVVKRKVSRSLYARQALNYFQRAVALMPEDPWLRCYAATTSLSLDDNRPMQSLNNDASPHFLLGYEFASEADVRRSSSESARYYRLALKEYQRAIDRAPEYTDALNNYAYTFWSWESHLSPPPQASSALVPNQEIAYQAEKYARLAVRLAAGRTSHTREAMFRDTLGEVLLAEGKVDKSIEVLEEADKQGVSRDAYFNEIRWDLIQAYDREGRNNMRACEKLNEIEKTEETRELQPFTESPKLKSLGKRCVKKGNANRKRQH